MTDDWDAIEARADGAGRGVPRPHRADDRHRHDARRARAARRSRILVKVRALRARTASARERVAKGGRSMGRALRRVLPSASTARTRPTSCSPCSATCSRRRPMRPLELTVEGFRSYREPTTFDWRGSAAGRHRRARSARGSPRSWMRSRSRCTARRRGVGARHEVADPPAVRPVRTWSSCSRSTARCGGRVRALRARASPGISSELLAADEPDAEVLEIVDDARAP